MQITQKCEEMYNNEFACIIYNYSSSCFIGTPDNAGGETPTRKGVVRNYIPAQMHENF